MGRGKRSLIQAFFLTASHISSNFECNIETRLTVNILTLVVKGIKKGACFNMSFALVPSITA